MCGNITSILFRNLLTFPRTSNEKRNASHRRMRVEMFNAIVLFFCFLVAVPQVAPGRTPYNPKSIQDMVERTTLCAACMYIDEVKIVVQNCRFRLPFACKVRELRCVTYNMGSYPQFMGEKWERLCKVNGLSFKIAKCAFESKECVVSQKERRTKPGKRRLKYIYNFVKCLREVEETFCLDSSLATVKRSPLLFDD
ncbi:hypothetical protein NPIL_596431 [Nephila pilipes]|uniref:Uncharacterized protein n=1 Tax=Nephila pilipes TaxID=299642 RepID=A0A8X6NY04_NEPPI|nr:hypothetical protein NPIL_596431 [Nephila pilipes]